MVETCAGSFSKQQFHDGYFVIYFENGDVRQTYPDGKVVYLFKNAGVT
jgi:hypothetical protein